MILFKSMFTFNVLPESLERKYFSVHIPIFYTFAFHSSKVFFVNCVMVFSFYKMHCFKWRRRKVANNYVLGL